jgi:hypothetical protein
LEDRLMEPREVNDENDCSSDKLIVE